MVLFARKPRITKERLTNCAGVVHILVALETEEVVDDAINHVDKQPGVVAYRRDRPILKTCATFRLCLKRIVFSLVEWCSDTAKTDS